MNSHWEHLGLDNELRRPGSSSFVEFLRRYDPTLLPQPPISGGEVIAAGPEGTTIVALRYAGGVIMAGDRRATMGSAIAYRDMRKVFATDVYSAIGIAGSAGLAIELVRLFSLELEHYEKIESSPLSMDGKANRLAAMVRSNLPTAMRGMVALPLFGGYDTGRAEGRLFSYDVAGGRYEEKEYHSIGSGSAYARGSMKKLWHPGLDAGAAEQVAIHALLDAADDDSATGGVDEERGIYPIVMRIDRDGHEELTDQDVAAVVARVRELARRSR